MNIRPLNNVVLFQFLDETGGSKGSFTEAARASGIIIPKTTSTQKVARWGKVVGVGPKVDGIDIGDYILVEALMWSFGVKLDDETKVWKTDDSKVMAVTTDIAECTSQAL